MNKELVLTTIEAIEKLIPLAQMSGCYGDDPALLLADDVINKLKALIEK